MSSVSELINEPVAFEVGGKTLRFKRLGVMRRIAISEQVARERDLAAIRDEANAFDDPAKRSAWIAEQLEARRKREHDPQPQGAARNIQTEYAVILRIATASCVDGISEHQMDALLEAAGDGEVKPLLAHLIGRKNSDARRESGLSSSAPSQDGTASA